MVKTRIAVCSLIACAVILLLSSVQCTAEQGEKPAEPEQSMVNTEGFEPRPEDLYVVVRIIIHPSGGGNWEIKAVTPKGPDICKNMDKPICDGTQFLWTVVGHPMAVGDRVIVRKASFAKSCFAWDEWVIDGPNSAITSGAVTCDMTPDEMKYGVFWPYDVEFYQDGELKASTDPRGILR